MATDESPVYESPVVSELGSLDELTQSTVHKTAGSGDVIVINGQENPIPVPGATVTSVS